MSTPAIPAPLPITMPRPHRRWGQITALVAFWVVLEKLAALWHWPVPGSLVGLAVLWLLLDRGILPASWIEHGADGLLNHLMLFFVPAMLAVLNHQELFGWLGLKLLAAVLAGTVIVMCGTALVVEIGFRLTSNRSSR